MDLRNLSISSMLPTSTVFYDISKIKQLREGSFEPEPRRLVWIKEKPQLVNLLDKHLRKTFTIPDGGMMVFTLYQPPEKGDENVLIKKPKQKLFSRVILSTIAESPELRLMGKKRETMKMKSGEAYSIPYPVNNMTEIEFDNKRTVIIPPRKGFRQQKMTKRIENRYIMVFDYIYTDEIKQAVSELTGKDEEIRGYGNSDTATEEQGTETSTEAVSLPDNAERQESQQES